MSLRSKLIICFLPIVCIGIGAITAFSYTTTLRELRESAIRMQWDTLSQTSHFMSDRFSAIYSQVAILESSPYFVRFFFPATGVGNLRVEMLINFYRLMNNAHNAIGESLDSITLLVDNRAYYIIPGLIYTGVNFDMEPWFEVTRQLDSNRFWVNSHTDEVFLTIPEREVMTFGQIYYNPWTNTSGMLLVHMRSAYFIDIMQNAVISENGYMFLLSPDSIIKSAHVYEQYSLPDSVLEQILSAPEERGELSVVSQGGESVIVLYNTIMPMGWRVGTVIPYSDLLSPQFRFSLNLILIIASTLMLLGCGIVALIAHRISGKITYLSRQVCKVEAGDFDTEFIASSKDEIGALAAGLSSMTKTIKSLISKIYEIEKNKRKTQLYALQSQINSHFFYNTLASIRHLIKMGESASAINMVNYMARFMRLSLNTRGQVVIMRDEIDHLTDYLRIQKMRYSSSFEYEIDIPEQLYDACVIKLTLQPLAENALYHGVKNLKEQGIIRISAKASENSLIIRIEDNGVGIEKQRLEIIQKAISGSDFGAKEIAFGLCNVNERIGLYFGQQYGIDIESEAGRYTYITMTLPLVWYDTELLSE